MAKKPARKSRPDVNGSATKSGPTIEPTPDPLLTDPAIHADLKPLSDALVMVSVRPKLFQDKQVALLSAPGIDTGDPRAVLERFRVRLLDWDFNRKLGEQLRHKARELGASEPDKASVDDALGALLATLEVELRDLLPHAVRHADAVGADVAAFVPAVNTPTRENMDRAEAALVVARARVDSGRRMAASEADPGAIDRAIDLAAERTAEKLARVLGDNGRAATNKLPVHTEVVLWEGAEHNARNVRLARTRTAYLEAHGDVPAAMAALKETGNPVARSTFYNHLDALDKAIPRWRESVQLSNPTGNPDGMRNVRTRGKSRDKVR